MNPKVKSFLSFVLKAGLAVLIFWQIFDYDHRLPVLKKVLPKIEFREVLEKGQNANYLYAIPQVLVILTILCLAALRWHQLLRIQRINLPLWRAMAITAIGNFFNCFLPGGTGGDLIKVVYAVNAAPDKKTEVVSTMVMDRLIGVTGILIVILTMGIIHASKVSEIFKIIGASFGGSKGGGGFSLIHIVLLIGAMGVVCLLLIVALRATFERKSPWLARCYRAFDTIKEKTVTALKMYSASGPQFFLTLVYSVAIHLLLVFIPYFAALAIDEKNASLLAFMLIIPVVNLVTSIPISVGGLGVRELVLIPLLAVFGVGQSEAIFISLVWFIMVPLGNLPGGLVYLFYKQNKSNPDPEPEVGTPLKS